MTTDRDLEPLGDPDEDVADFADEHDATAVDPGIVAGGDDGEPESPDGWDGLDREGPP
jgi:hypothetical protein